MNSDNITPCPGCGTVSSEDYDGRGHCWDCRDAVSNAMPGVTRAAAITPKPVHWLWWPFVPEGKLTAIAGPMGQAKSLWTCWIHARVSTGTGVNSAARNTLLLNAEDDPDDTIRPRLEAAGADLDRVYVQTTVELDADRLAATCDHIGDVGLITIDPIQAYLPAGVNSWKGQDVRQALEPIRQLAANRQIAVGLVQHLNRRSDTKDPLARIADSQGIPQLCRSVLIWGADPSDPDGDRGTAKVLTQAKSNLARGTDSATFVIAERVLPSGLKAATLDRGADRRISAEEVVDDPEARSALEEACEWLRAQLDNASAGQIDAQDAMKRARDDGITERTLRRAKDKLRVKSQQVRNGDAVSRWVWTKAPINPLGHVGNVGHLGHVGPQVAKAANAANVSNVNNGSVDHRHAPSTDEQDLAERLLADHEDLA